MKLNIFIYVCMYVSSILKKHTPALFSEQSNEMFLYFQQKKRQQIKIVDSDI